MQALGLMPNPRLLLVDDDQRLAALLVATLTPRGFVVEHRADAATGLPAALHGGYDALLLDLTLPDGDGLSICRAIRAVSDLPILMLTARGDELDRIIGLELGADDYLPKPFNPRELEARVRAILRRRLPAAAPPPSPTPSPTLWRFGRITLDLDARELRVDGAPRRLTSHQLDLVIALARKPGRVLSSDQLLEELGVEEDSFDRSVDVTISRVRAAIEDNPKEPRWIRTIRGVGYSFTPTDDP